LKKHLHKRCCRYHFDCDGLHCHPHEAGFKIRIHDEAMYGLSFLFKYVRSEYGIFEVGFDDVDSSFPLDGIKLGLSFCIDCGAFTHFGSRYEVCWRCEDSLE
jgi:hypothetical protein